MSVHINYNQGSNFTNTAKLPIDVVKRLIAAVALRPNLWMRNHNGQKRCDVSQLWYEVSHEVQLPADICRIKWGHLRDNFRKVFIRNTFSDETPTTWRFYNDMRFMEKSVAENVMRQNRNKTYNRFWPDLRDQILQSESKILSSPSTLNSPICELRENPPEAAAYFDEANAIKHIKQENGAFYRGAEFNLDLMKKSYTESIGEEKSKDSDIFISDDYTQPDQDYDDDDFDEDAITEENDQETLQTATGQKHKRKANDEIFTIEVFDDDEDVTPAPKNALSAHPNREETKFCPSEKQLDEIHSYSTVNEDAHEQNADRMFLLSLLPYLQKVDPQRKLHVRQKLQKVLIEEFG